MKKFRFVYTPIVWILLSVVAALCLAGLIWNAFIIAAQNDGEVLNLIINILITIVNAGALCVVISMLVYGKYVVKDKKLIVYFGFIRTTHNVLDIVQISHFKSSNKLVIYFKSAEYSVIVISPEKYSAFVDSLIAVNQNIIYTLGEENDKQ